MDVEVDERCVGHAEADTVQTPSAGTSRTALAARLRRICLAGPFVTCSWPCSERPQEPERRRQADHYAAAVYGSIVAASLIVAFFEQHGSAETMALTLLSTMAVFFLAHVWSAIVGERIHRAPRYSSRHTLAVARAEWPLVESSFGPVVVLILGWAGVWSDHTAERLALGVCLVELFVWGVVGRAEGLRHVGIGALLSGVVNVALGRSP